MAAVWLAEDETLGRKVAVKFALDARASRSSERLAIEARAAASLSHPNVVRVYDFGHEEGHPYLVMEHLEGEDLGTLLDRVDTLPLHKALVWTRRIAEGLRAVHDAGYIHRDVKPKNVFVERDGENLKLLDFGIVRTADTESLELTEDGLVLGSAPYMSPEQARGQPLTPASDLWSLAAILYRMLTGESPFAGAHPTDSLIRVCTVRPDAPSKLVPSLSPSVDDFFARTFAAAAERRPRSVAEFLSALDDISADRPARPPQEQRGRDTETEPLPAVPAARVSTLTKPRWALTIGVVVALGVAIALLVAERHREAGLREPLAETTAERKETAPPDARTSSTENSTPAAPPRAETSRAVTEGRPSTSRAAATTEKRPRVEPEAATSIDPVFGLPVSSP